MKRNVKDFIALLFLCCCLLTCGCNSPRTQDVPERPIRAFPYQAEHAGLLIGVDVFKEPKRIKKHFGMNLLDRRVLPVLVGFENVSAQEAFLLQPQSVVLLGDSYEQREDPYPVKEFSSKAGQALDEVVMSSEIAEIGMMTAMVALPMIVLPVGLGLDDYAGDWRDTAIHMERIRFSDKPLYPTDSTNGFIYFQLSEVGDARKVEALQFRLKGMHSREETSVIVRIHK